MPDVFTQAKRSAVMSSIRSRGNKDTELRLIAVFRANGITGWRRSVTIRVPEEEGHAKPPRRKEKLTKKNVGGSALRLGVFARNLRQRLFSVRPDFVFPKLKLAVFVDGCFWHGCPQHFKRPKSRQVFWDAKILGNKRRDRRVNLILRKVGWRVVRVWEHELVRKNETKFVRRLGGLFGAKRGRAPGDVKRW